MERRYDPRDSTMSFVDRGDDLDPMADDSGSLRALMSCGHAVTPDSVRGWCQSLLNEGDHRFRCPALKSDNTRCNALWSYREVRRLGDLNVKEMAEIEEKMALLAATEYCEFKPCPQCKSYVERANLTNLCVQCTICTAIKGLAFQFCWQCLKKWKGPGPRSERCDNEGCSNKDLELLQGCKTIDLPAVRGVTNCPAIRLCPTCGLRVEHNTNACKNILCPRCKVSFCFVCLKLKSECSKTSTPYQLCPAGVAPRQTSIPKWCRDK